MKRIGLSGTVKSVAWEADFARVLSDTGKQYSSFNFSDYSEKLGFLPMTIYRGDLIRVLHEALDTKNTEIHLNEGVESFEHVNPSDQKSNVQIRVISQPRVAAGSFPRTVIVRRQRTETRIPE